MKKTIQISVGQSIGKGKVVAMIEVAADVYGDFAVHRQYHNEEFWSITHVPSGYLVRQGYPKKRIAMIKAKMLNEAGIQFSNPEEALEYKDQMVEILLDPI
jgi:hypothetical protein